MKVVVLHDAVRADARKDELDVLTQARVVMDCLAELGHEASCLEFGLNAEAAGEALQRIRPDCVFNIVESIAGQGRLIHLAPAVLDMLGLAYTGAPTDAMYVTSNKLLAKTVFRGARIPTAVWYTTEGPADAEPFAPGRYIVKSVWEHASVGLGDDAIVEVDHLDALRGLIARRASALGGTAFAERYIEGREFNISLLTRGPGEPPQVLPHAEIIFDDYPADLPRIVDYRAKWEEDSFEYNHTRRRFDFPRTDRPLLDALTSICLDCWRIVGLRGYARVDFRVDAAGRPFVLEINANPCLSPDAGFAAALAQAKITSAEAVRRIVTDVSMSPN